MTGAYVTRVVISHRLQCFGIRDHLSDIQSSRYVVCHTRASNNVVPYVSLSGLLRDLSFVLAVYQG